MQAAEAIAEKATTQVDRFLYPHDDEKTAEKIGCSYCLREAANVVPSCRETSPEAQKWNECHLCREELLKLAKKMKAKCEYHTHAGSHA